MAEVQGLSRAQQVAALQERYDVLVIGGGIYGAWTAYDAVLRGASVLLVEAGDWGGGTSSASSKLIHGGLRYLEYGHVGLVHTAVTERGRLLRLGPHRVQRQRFHLPVWTDSRTRPWTFSLGLTLYDLLAGFGGVSRGAPTRHQRLRREALLQECPFLAAAGLTAGFTYEDAGEDDARYVLEIISGAIAAGATAINHCPMLRLTGAEAVTGAVLRDPASGAETTIQAQVTVLATGPWLPGISTQAGLSLPVRLNKGVHLVMPPLPGAAAGQALLLTAPSDRRVFFLIPWYGATLLGTTDTDWQGDPQRAEIDEADISYLLTALQARCPGLGWERGDIRGGYAGLRMLQNEPGKAASSVTREWTLSEPRPGLLVPIGGKLTSARSDAARIVDRLGQLLGRRTAWTGRTAALPLPWAPTTPAWQAEAQASGLALGLDAEVAHTMALRHGSQLHRVQEVLRAAPALRGRIHPLVPMVLGEALWAVQGEMAMSLDDVLRRRVPLAILAPLTRAQVAGVAAVIAPVLGWDVATTSAEAHGWWSRHDAQLQRLRGPTPAAAADAAAYSSEDGRDG